MTRRGTVSLDYRAPLMDEAEEHRKVAESLVRGMEVLAHRFGRLEIVPLDVVERHERILVAAHVANLQRIASLSERSLLALDPEAS